MTSTRPGIGLLSYPAPHLNALLDLSKGKPSQDIASLLRQGLDHLIKFGWIFGLFREEPKQYLDRMKKEGLKKLGVSEEEILTLIQERNAARKGKNWKRADEIRNDLLSKGVVLEDGLPPEPSGN
jgi:cysteinyl-tRNA synthetase